jgi:hypothetical protein
VNILKELLAVGFIIQAGNCRFLLLVKRISDKTRREQGIINTNFSCGQKAHSKIKCVKGTRARYTKNGVLFSIP